MNASFAMLTEMTPEELLASGASLVNEMRLRHGLEESYGKFLH